MYKWQSSKNWFMQGRHVFPEHRRHCTVPQAPGSFSAFYLFLKKNLLVMTLPPNQVCPTSQHRDTPLSSAKFQLRPKKQSHQKAGRTVSMLKISCWAAFIPHSGYVCLEGSRVDMPTRTSEETAILSERLTLSGNEVNIRHSRLSPCPTFC